MKLKTKLLGSFLVVILIFSVGNIYTMIKINLMQNNTSEINSNSIPSLTDIGTMNMEISDVPRLIEYYSLESSSNRASIENELNSTTSDIDNTLKHYQPLISTSEESQSFNNFLSDWNTYKKEIPSILNDVKANNISSAVNKITEAYPDWTSANKALDDLTALNQKKAAATAQNTMNAARSALYTSIILSLLAAIIGGILAFLLSSSILKAVRLLQSAAIKIAEGDLSNRVILKSTDELGELANTFNKMITDLRVMVGEVIETANNLAANSEELSAAAEEATAASEQVSDSVNKLASDAMDQAKAVQETKEMINELSASAQIVSDNAENMRRGSNKAVLAAQDGVQQADNAVAKIENIREVTSQIASVVELLGDQSQEIGQIVDVIKGIADQTNLLALNAAIEAARAGEQGRGFAVVADEVRKLAEQSSNSAGQIEALVRNIQTETLRAVQIMDKEQVEVAEGVKTVNSAGNAFEIIMAEINSVVEQVKQVSSAIEKMINGTSNAVLSINGIGVIAEENAGSAQEMSVTSEEQSATMVSVSQSAEQLAKYGENLLKLVARFQM